MAYLKRDLITYALGIGCDELDFVYEDADDFDDVVNNPTHLTLRLLFLDDDDLPMR